MRLPFHKKVAYGMGRFGSSLMLTFVGLSSFYIYGAKFELNWMLSGISLATSYVVIGLTHWLTGYISDKLESPWGRRKPFVVVGAPGLAITAFFLHVPNWFIDIADPTMQIPLFLYYMCTLSSFKFFYAFLLTAFQAWMPEITDEDERPLVSSMQNTANWMGNGIGVVTGFMAPMLFVESPTVMLSDFGLMLVLTFSLLIILAYLPAIVLVREKPDITIPPRNLIEETRTVLQNRVYVGWFMTVGFLSFTFSAIVSQIVGFAQEVLLLTTIGELLPAALALLLSIVVFLYLWIVAIHRFGKKTTMFVSLALLTVLLPFTPFVNGLIGYMSKTLVAIIFFVPLAAGMAVYYLMSYIVPADIAHVDELRTGESRSGMYTGFIGVPLNMFQAAASLLLGWLMDYSKSATGSNVWGFMWWGPMFAPFLIIAAFILRYVDIDPDFETLKAKAA